MGASCNNAMVAVNQPFTTKGQIIGLWWKDKKVMNESGNDENLTPSEKTPVELVAEIRKRMLSIKGQAMSDDGSSVDYAKVRDSESFAEYKQLVKQLKFVQLK